MAGREFGSLTKEPPLARLDETIRAIKPRMAYNTLLSFARTNTHRDAPGLIRNRYILLNADGTIAYDHFLSLANSHGLASPIVRKVMYFLWSYRDERIRRFVCEKIASKNGTWRASQLLRKQNADFFEAWMQPSTAKKARSNFEFFLVETGIFDPNSKEIHLELDDGWLEEAALAASQHEPDRIEREELLANPIRFLKDRGWLGLLNLDDSKEYEVSPILSSDALPLEDQSFSTGPNATLVANDWNRKSPSASGRKSTMAKIDLVARERANKSHYMLEQVLTSVAKDLGFAPKYNQNIDVFFELKSATLLAEIKSCTDSNFHAQTRKSISQLFEYKYLYRKLFKSSDVQMLLLMETMPPKEKMWLIDFVLSLGVILAWKDRASEKLVTTCNIPDSLVGIIQTYK